MYATFNRFELRMTRAQAESASHPGPCDADVEVMVRDKDIAKQLDSIGPDRIRAEEQLANDADNRSRIVWIAAGDIVEEMRRKSR